MLRGILFDLTPALAESLSVRELLCSLELSGIAFFLCSKSTQTTFAANPFLDMANNLALSPDDCLVLTDSAAGVRAAQSAGIPCIGYAPPGGCVDFSCAYCLFEDFASIDVSYLYRTHAHALGYPAEILTTERLIIREFCEDDFPALYAMCTVPETASFMKEQLSDYRTEEEKHRAYLQTVYPFFDLALWGVFKKDSGQLIGRAGFSLPEDDSDAFSLGYLIDVPYRKQGYAKECVPALLSYAFAQGYTEISAHIKKENYASIKVVEQCGFPYERKEDPIKKTVTYLIYPA